MKPTIRRAVKRSKIYFELIKTQQRGKPVWYFRIKSINGRILAHSETYTQKHNLLYTLTRFANPNNIIVRDKSLDIPHYPCWYELNPDGHRFARVFWGEHKWHEQAIFGCYRIAVETCLLKMKHGISRKG